jgi:hypothetical protein
MTNPKRCIRAKFAVKTETQHTFLAHACLQTMSRLRRDMCGIENPTILNSEIPDLPLRITRRIPSHLLYACRHWALHVTNASVSDDLLNLIMEFCSKYLLYWVEVCSLLGELRNALIALHAVQQFFAVSLILFLMTWMMLISSHREKERP